MAIKTGNRRKCRCLGYDVGREVATLEAHKMSLSSRAFRPDGSSLITAGQELRRPAMRFSPGGDSAEWGVESLGCKDVGNLASRDRFREVERHAQRFLKMGAELR